MQLIVFALYIPYSVHDDNFAFLHLHLTTTAFLTLASTFHQFQTCITGYWCSHPNWYPFFAHANQAPIIIHINFIFVSGHFHCTNSTNVNYSLMRGRIKGPRPLVNPMQSDKTFITWVIKILHGNGAPKATNLRLATRMSLPAATICSALTAAVYKIR